MGGVPSVPKPILFMLAIITLPVFVACAIRTTVEQPATTPTATAITRNDFEAAPPPSGRNLQPNLKNITVDMDEVVALLPPDAIPAVLPDDVPQIMVSAADADAGGMEADIRVLGISINGESHAYPIPFMSRVEIVNDEVGGKYIAATW